MIYTLHREQQLAVDIQTAWDFFSSPHNLERITPKEMKFVVLSDIAQQKMFSGMKIKYTVRPFLGIPLRWKTRIEEVIPYQKFVDIQERGPYRLWEHTHHFVENDKGVFMTDVVRYELPFGPIGDLVHRLLVRRKLHHIFDYRYKAVERLFHVKNTSL